MGAAMTLILHGLRASTRPGAIQFSGGMFGPLGHTWSLAIEEQFYLLWPLVVAGMWNVRQRRWLPRLMAMGTLYAIIGRLALWDGGAGLARVYMGFDLHLDALLVGCWLAFAMRRRRDGEAHGLIALALVAAVVPLSLLGDGFGRYVVATTATPLLTAALIFCVAQGGGVPWLRWRPLTITGKVSYGLYLWHFPLLFALGPLVQGRLGALTVPSMLALAAICTWMSWRFIERPFLKLKDRDKAAPADQRAPRAVTEAIGAV